MHVHSNWSYDAFWPLEAIAFAFRKRRYDVVLMAEHDTGFTEDAWQRYRQSCSLLSTENFLLVPGLEYGDSENRVHIATWGDLPFLGERRATREVLEEVRRGGGFSVFAHPHRKGALGMFDEDWLPLLDGYELWNRKYDGWAPNVSTAQKLPLDEKGVRPIVALDFHSARQFFPLSMTLDIRGSLCEREVIDALSGGRSEPRALRLPTRIVTPNRTCSCPRS